jgi:Holliday junction resolvase-like predicted endonuclease
MPELPSSFTKSVERFQRLLPTLQSGADLVAEIEQRRITLAALFEPYDAVHLLGQLIMSEIPYDADLYVESEHPGAAYVVEIAAAILAARPSRAGAKSPTPPLGAHVLEPTRDQIAELVLLESIRRMQAAGAGIDPFGSARGRAAMQHLMLRGPGWAWQGNRLLTDLFGEPRLTAVLKDALGFGPVEAVVCMETIGRLLPRRMHEFMLDAPNRRDEAMDWARATLRGWEKEPDVEKREHMLSVLWAMLHVGDALLVAPDELAAEAKIDDASVASFLKAMSFRFGETRSLFQVAETVRFSPYLEAEPDRYLCTVPGNDLWGVRPLFESVLKEDAAYLRHRGRWTEAEASRLLAASVKADEIHRSVDIVDRQTSERLGEIDALHRFGDVVILIEAKSASLRPGARRGGEALIRHLKDNVTKAAEQASLARQVLNGEIDAELRTSAGVALDLGEPVREVHPILVTLDDLSAVAPVIWELAETDVIPTGAPMPWTVTLHELELASILFEYPVQLVHFLRRRARLNQLGDHVASDELDWVMLYLSTGLYLEDKPAGRTRYLSQTDALDAWVLYEKGLREQPAEKPRQHLGADTQRFIETLCDERPSGWVAAGATLLELSGEAGEQLHTAIRQARGRAVKRDLVQRCTFGFTDAPGSMLVCVVVVPDAEASHLLDHLGVLVTERLDEHDADRVLGIGVTASSTRPYDALMVGEPEVWRLPVGDGGQAP